MCTINEPYKIAIVGGIGSGKSVIAHLFGLMGVPVYNCDAEAKRLMNADASIRKKLKASIDEQVYKSDGTLNRRYLASYMFGYPERVALVNSIVHPIVRSDFKKWAIHKKSPIVAVESAILFESGMDADVDAIILAYAPESLRLRRAILRDKSDKASVRQRMKSQMAYEDLITHANFVITNDDTTSLIEQVQNVINQLTQNNLEA